VPHHGRGPKPMISDPAEKERTPPQHAQRWTESSFCQPSIALCTVFLTQPGVREHDNEDQNTDVPWPSLGNVGTKEPDEREQPKSDTEGEPSPGRCLVLVAGMNPPSKNQTMSCNISYVRRCQGRTQTAVQRNVCPATAKPASSSGRVGEASCNS
jgi:hypothetical protein